MMAGKVRAKPVNRYGVNEPPQNLTKRNNLYAAVRVSGGWGIRNTTLDMPLEGLYESEEDAQRTIDRIQCRVSKFGGKVLHVIVHADGPVTTDWLAKEWFRSLHPRDVEKAVDRLITLGMVEYLKEKGRCAPTAAGREFVGVK